MDRAVVRVSRRRFIELVGVVGGGSVVAACAPAAVSSPLPSASARATPAQGVASPGASVGAPALASILTWYAQAAFRWSDAKIVYVDPGTWLSGETPTADLVLITHPHGDHFDKAAIAKIVGPNTVVVGPKDVTAQLAGSVQTVKPGDAIKAAGVSVQVVPAYNSDPARQGFHPKANGWVGYVFELGGRTYYHAGDTDALPELRTLKADVVLLPIGGAFTMPVEEAADLAKAQRPTLAVPMHYGYVTGPGGKVGVAGDGERFRSAAAPVQVEVLTPVVPFKNL